MSWVFFVFCLQLLEIAVGQRGSNIVCRTPDRQTGSCIPIQSCQPMLNFLDEVPVPVPKNIEKFLKSYQCGFQGNKPKVCCSSNPIRFNGIDPGPDNQQFPDVSSHRNIGLLPEDCGHLDTEEKIVNGEKTGLFEFPWMALLSYKTRNGPEFKCGGTIVNERYILTAAHCLKNLKWPLLGVRVGEHNIKTQIDCQTSKLGKTCAPPYQDLRIEEIIPHPSYNAKDFSNDIGLIRVAEINLSLENSRPICLPLGESRNDDFLQKITVVTGWGVTEKNVPSPELLKVSLRVTPLQECQNLYSSVAKLDYRQFCAGGKNGKDSCGGDSGGPLHSVGPKNDDFKYVQQGIVSFGPSRCGKVPIPGVYTRVAAFMDWILDNLRP